MNTNSECFFRKTVESFFIMAIRFSYLRTYQISLISIHSVFGQGIRLLDFMGFNEKQHFFFLIKCFLLTLRLYMFI